jgi:hypothetical protein
MTEKNDGLDETQATEPNKRRQEAWLSLRGILKDVYAEYGGGEACLRQVREGWDQDAELDQMPIQKRPGRSGS